MTWRPALVACCAMTLAGCDKLLTGDYILQAPSEVAMLSLVETPDHHLTGRLADVNLLPSGELKKPAVALTGVRSGAALTLDVPGAAIWTGAATMTGRVEAGRIVIDTAASQLVFSRGQSNTYYRGIADLAKRAQSIVAAQAQANVEAAARATASSQAAAATSQATTVTALLPRVASLDQTLEALPDKVGQAQRSLDGELASMTKVFNDEREIGDDTSTAYARSQRAAAIQLAATRLRTEADTIRRGLKALAEQSTKANMELTAASAGCSTTNEASLRSVCLQLIDASKRHTAAGKAAEAVANDMARDLAEAQTHSQHIVDQSQALAAQ